MNRRIKRKIYKRDMCIVVYGISIDGFWRKRLFSSENDCNHLLNKSTANLPDEVKNIIVKYNLKINVCKSKNTPDESGVIFKFTSVEFDDIISYSENNPEVIGKSKYLDKKEW